jgi:hypothetical protein
LWRSGRGLRQRAKNGAAREINFEGIVREALGAAQQYFGCFRKGIESAG